MLFYKDDAFTPETSVGYLTKRVNQLSMQRLEPVFAANDITYLQWAALVSIWWFQNLTCAALARSIAHDTGATTRLLDSLEKRRWVERVRNQDDRRVVQLVLTPDGESVARTVRSQVASCWNAWLEDWQPEEAEILLRLLGRLRDTLETKEAVCG